MNDYERILVEQGTKLRSIESRIDSCMRLLNIVRSDYDTLIREIRKNRKMEPQKTVDIGGLFQ